MRMEKTGSRPIDDVIAGIDAIARLGSAFDEAAVSFRQFEWSIFGGDFSHAVNAEGLVGRLVFPNICSQCGWLCRSFPRHMRRHHRGNL